MVRSGGLGVKRWLGMRDADGQAGALFSHLSSGALGLSGQTITVSNSCSS